MKVKWRGRSEVEWSVCTGKYGNIYKDCHTKVCFVGLQSMFKMHNQGKQYTCRKWSTVGPHV